MKACRVVRETAVQTETKESSHQTSGQSAGAIGRKRLGKEQVCKWGLGSSRASKVKAEDKDQYFRGEYSRKVSSL